MADTKTGSAYDRLISEDFYKTPDMGEYMNNYIYLKNQKGISNNEKASTEDTSYFVENPPVTETGYYKDLGVVAARLSPSQVKDKYMIGNETYSPTEYNSYDGDTVYFSLNNMVNDNTTPFQVYYDNEHVFSGVKDYLRETLNLNRLKDKDGDIIDDDALSVRFIGFNAPEIVHYRKMIGSVKEEDIYRCTYSQLTNNSVNVVTNKGTFKKSKFIYKPFNGDGSEIKERTADTVISFLRIQLDSKAYPDVKESQRDLFYEIAGSENKKETDTLYIEKTGTGNFPVYKCVLASEGHEYPLEYHKQAEQAQQVVLEAFEKASECIVLLDTCGLNGVKSNIPQEYKQSFEKSSSAPLDIWYDLWKSIEGQKAAYKYSGYRVPGQETNGRFLGAFYLKIKNNGVDQWINLNKKVIYELGGTDPNKECYLEIRPYYSSSMNSIAANNYLADGFKLWSYTDRSHLYIDSLSEEVYKTKDDREQIQRELTGQTLEQLKEYTVMIGDTLLMIPPTSIRTVSQTRSTKTHLARSRGSMTKQLPKTERIIELDLFFNGDEGINGIPYNTILPNGEEITYYMNGLRGLIAQFKVAPFLPIHNEYINNILNIDAVALVNYTVATVPNYPRTLKVTLSMYEFDWRQYMPEQSMPDINSDKGLFSNGYSDTIYFPLLRYHYQQALIRGEKLANDFDYASLSINDPSYISQTIGAKTSLQPMTFSKPTLKMFVPNRDHLALKKQLKILQQTRPFGQTFTFTKEEEKFIAAMFHVQELISLSTSKMDETINEINNSAGENGYISLRVSRYVKQLVYSSEQLKNGDAKLVISALNEKGENISFNVNESKVSASEYYGYLLEDLLKELNVLYQEKREYISDVVNGFKITFVAGQEAATASIKFELGINASYISLGLDNIKTFASKYAQVEAASLFKDDSIQLEYVAKFEPQKILGVIYKDNCMTKPFTFVSKDQDNTLKAIKFLAGLSDDANTSGTEDFNINDSLENLKDSIDVEDQDSIQFDEVSFGDKEPIITSITSSYNNIYSNVSLKATDGHASQFTGGSDSSLIIEMIGDEEAVSTVNWISRVCVDYLIQYRKVLLCSPLRIDCELARFLGIHEVVIESVEVNTIPEQPGLFAISLTLNSVDRTLRNRENLEKIKNVSNEDVDYNSVINAKNYFDLQAALGKAELYPDLELPTIQELEKKGYYFMKTNYQSERTFVDPDFYFVYWYPTLANNIRTSITEYFSDPTTLKYNIEDNMFADSFNLDLELKKSNGESGFIFNVDGESWDARGKSYEEVVEAFQKLADAGVIDDNYDKTYAKQVVKLDQLNTVINKLSESITSATYNTTQVNSIINVTVNDEDLLLTGVDAEQSEEQESINNKIEKLNKDLRNGFIDMLKADISPSYDKKRKLQDDFFAPYHCKNEWTYHSDGTSNNDKTFNIGDDLANFLYKQLSNGLEPDTKGTAYTNLNYKMITMINKASALGNMATKSVFSVSEGEVDGSWINIPSGETKPEPSCFPPRFAEVTDKNGKTIQAPIVLYPSDETSNYQIATNDEERAKGVIFSRYGLKKYTKSELNSILKNTPTTDGFLDPFCNNDVRRYLNSKIKDENKKFKILTADELKANEKTYIDGILNDYYYAADAFQRQMIIWMIILIDNNSLVNDSIYHAGYLAELGVNGDKVFNSRELAAISKSVLEISDEENLLDGGVGGAIVETACNWGRNIYSWGKSVCNAIIKNDSSNVDVGLEQTKDAANKIDDQQSKADDYIEMIVDNSGKYFASIVHGLLFTASAIAMTGPDSPVLTAVTCGDLGAYTGLIENASALIDTTDELSEETLRFSRFVQYINYYFRGSEDEQNEKSPLLNYAYNNKVQRAYLAAANDPSVYLLHSYYDMVMNDKRGSMARAFPTYYMLLVDEGREIGLWRLQDNFYNMNNIVEFEVVRSRKIAADTARIVMTNLYGVFTSDDEDQKDENIYTMKDVWTSIFSPRSYFQQEFIRRKNARDINRAKMQPGARVHLRAGYGSNAAELPILFNGVVAEFEAGDTMTLVCQGDGIELANPSMFNAMDVKDVQDIQYNPEFLGWKQLQEAWDDISSARDMLVLPLAAEGTFIQEIIRKWSSGRFFNSNPFGISHFGDRKYQDIFPTNGEVEQNIYECLSKPTWDYVSSGQAGMETITSSISDDYALDEAPKVRVKLNNGFSYWDLMGIAASLSPEFICAIAPFQLRSTIFHGAPRYYYAYDYIRQNGKIIEKRKPYQQCHVITSYSDIIDNKMSTSTNIKTNVVGHYVGPGWWSSTPKTVGPLWSDIDIFPENQKTTSIDLNFEYKTGMFNVPVWSKLQETFDWTDGPNGEKTAWRASASYLKDCMKDMYTGEIIIIGNPAMKPYDRLTIADTYEDISGTVEIEQVVHMFSADTGYTTAITPDFITAVDNKYETLHNAASMNVISPALIAFGFNVAIARSFNSTNRPLYLGLARAFGKGGNASVTAFNKTANFVGKEGLQKDVGMITPYLTESMKAVLDITDADIELYNIVKNISKVGSSFKTVNINSTKSFLNVIDSILDLEDTLKVADASNMQTLETLLSSEAFKAKDQGQDAIKAINELKLTDEITNMKKLAKLDAVDVKELKSALTALNTSDADKLIKLLDSSKDGIDLLSKDGKDILKLYRSIVSSSDDIASLALSSKFTKISEGLAKSAKTFAMIDDATDSVRTMKHAITGIKTGLKATLPGIILAAIEVVLTKGAQNYITNKMRNWQVLTMYPVKKDNKVWTAGIEGHQGSVVGSLTYDEPGWLEKCAINFFDDSSWGGFLRDVFITTPEMKEIVDNFKRGEGITTMNPSEEKARVEAKNYISEKLALNSIESYSDYKQLYFDRAISLKDIKDGTQEARVALASYRMTGIENIETTSEIGSKLVCVTSNKLIEKLYKNNAFKVLDKDFIYEDEKTNTKLAIKKKSIIQPDSSKKLETYVKEIGNTTPPVYDVPFLRPKALTLLDNVVRTILKEIQPDYESELCTFDKIKTNPIILKSATRINSNEGWRSTGFLFTIEVKNYNNFSNIITEIEEQRDALVKTVDASSSVFTVQKDSGNVYSFFCHCPEL